MKKIFISILIISITGFIGYSAYTNIIGSFKNSDAGGMANDNWSFSGDYIYTDLHSINFHT